MRVANQEQPFHPIYNYAVITDAEEGLILVDVDTLADGEPRNNFLKRALTWNPGGVLNGARHIALGGQLRLHRDAERRWSWWTSTIRCSRRSRATCRMNDLRASRCSSATCSRSIAGGLQVIDVTQPGKPRRGGRAHACRSPMRTSSTSRAPTPTWPPARRGLAIVDIEKPEKPRLYATFNAERGDHDARDVVVATTNASLFAYVADGKGGLKVIQLTRPRRSRGSTASAPSPKPQLIASYRTADAGAVAVTASGTRPGGRRDRGPDRGLRTARLATIHRFRDA